MQYDYNGQTRREYLAGLADEYDIPARVVYVLASMLGPSEDFDGLVTELQDIADSGDYFGICPD